MQRPYPGAIRVRVIDFVEAGGSRRDAAEQFDVCVSSAVRWVQSFRSDGRSEPMPRGGRISPLERHSQRIFALIGEQPDLTLARSFERSPAPNVSSTSSMHVINQFDREML
jgi:transposase